MDRRQILEAKQRQRDHRKRNYRATRVINHYLWRDGKIKPQTSNCEAVLENTIEQIRSLRSSNLELPVRKRMEIWFRYKRDHVSKTLIMFKRLVTELETVILVAEENKDHTHMLQFKAFLAKRNKQFGQINDAVSSLDKYFYNEAVMEEIPVEQWKDIPFESTH